MVEAQIGEAARLLGISADTVRRRAAAGKFDQRLLGAEWIEDDGEKGYWLLEVADANFHYWGE